MSVGCWAGRMGMRLAAQMVCLWAVWTVVQRVDRMVARMEPQMAEMTDASLVGMLAHSTVVPKAEMLGCQRAVLLGVPMADLMEKKMAAMWVVQMVAKMAACLDLKTAAVWENSSVASTVVRTGHMSADSKGYLWAASTVSPMAALWESTKADRWEMNLVELLATP